MSELTPTLAWTFVSRIQTPDNVSEILVEGEKAVISYKTMRDVATITNKRIIIADKQGLRGKKIEIYSIPFNSINMWSSENAHGIFDFNSELELWTRAGHFKINLNKGINIRELDKVIAEYVL